MNDEQESLDQFIQTSGSQVSEKQSTSLGQLPTDWDVRSIGDDFDIEYGKEKQEKELQSDGHPVYGANGIIGYGDEYLFEESTVTVTCRGATCGNINLTKPKSWVTNNSLVLLQNVQINKQFLTDALRYHSVERAISGSAQPQITATMLGKMDYPVPPLPEQRKVATVLYTVDQAIEKTEKIITQIKYILSGVTDELLIGGHGNKDLKQQRIYSFEFRVPTNWEVVELKTLNKDSKPICYGIVQPGDYHENGIPILNIEHSRYGDDIDVDDLHRVDTQLHEKYSRSKLTGGEIVISVKGSTGDVARVPTNIDEWNISRDLARISPIEKINRDWLRFYLSTTLAQKIIHVNSPGSTRDSLNIGDLKELPILLPPQEEQDQIAEVVAQIEYKLDSEKKYLNQLQRLKRGLMKDLLSGTVRTTDTNIEVPDEIAQHG